MKAKGSRNELKSKTLLESCGYEVTKSGGSLGDWDLVDVPLGQPDTVSVVCQVKSNRWPSPAEMETLRESEVNARKLVHRWDDREKFPKVKVL